MSWVHSVGCVELDFDDFIFCLEEHDIEESLRQNRRAPSPSLAVLNRESSPKPRTRLNPRSRLFVPGCYQGATTPTWDQVPATSSDLQVASFAASAPSARNCQGARTQPAPKADS